MREVLAAFGIIVVAWVLIDPQGAGHDLRGTYDLFMEGWNG